MKRLIFGCGYLGVPAGRRWVQAGDSVLALTRSESRFDELEAFGFQPRIGDVTRPETLVGLPVTDTVLFAVAMDRSRYTDIREVYVEGLRNVLERLPDETGHFIYVSSTGVYGDARGNWIDEDSPTHPTREAGKACLEAEALIRESQFGDRFTILRFAGIYGPGRIPFRSAIESRTWDRLSPGGHLNLIHVADGARAIEIVSQNRPFRETILVSDGNPVVRREFYDTVASCLSLGPIEWPDKPDGPTRGRGNKRISNQKLRRILKLEFTYPDHKSGLVGCCEKQ